MPLHNNVILMFFLRTWQVPLIFEHIRGFLSFYPFRVLPNI